MRTLTTAIRSYDAPVPIVFFLSERVKNESFFKSSSLSCKKNCIINPIIHWTLETYRC